MDGDHGRQRQGRRKKRTQAQCQYGPDGKVQKTTIAATPPPPERRGIRGRIAGKKQEEMKDYVERLRSLLSRYVPPDPQALRAALQSGKATLNPGTGDLIITDYAKPGDQVTFTFDPAAKALRSFAVATYLDAPNERVTLNARFSKLPDGTNFMEQSEVDASEKQIQIKTTNFDYRRIG